MGKRIRAARWFIHTLRHCEQPRYSFEHAAANILFGLVCVILSLLGEFRLWFELFAVMMLSIGVQGLRAWWFMRRRNRERETLMRVMQEEANA